MLLLVTALVVCVALGFVLVSHPGNHRIAAALDAGLARSFHFGAPPWPGNHMIAAALDAGLARDLRVWLWASFWRTRGYRMSILL